MEPSSLAAVAGDGVAIREAAAARDQAAAAGGGWGGAWGNGRGDFPGPAGHSKRG